EPELDRHGIAAPEERQEEGEQRAAEIDVPAFDHGRSTIIERMKIGLVGLPKSGKTTLFNLLTGSSVATARYDTGRAELHTGVARRLERLDASIKKQRKEPEVKERDLLVRLEAALEAERPLRAESRTADEDKLLRGFTFLSAKPIFHIVNLDEKAIAEGERVAETFGLAEIAARPRTRVGWVSAVRETEIARRPGEEQQRVLRGSGVAR